jgi:hypothetical protein
MMAERDPLPTALVRLWARFSYVSPNVHFWHLSDVY